MNRIHNTIFTGHTYTSNFHTIWNVTLTGVRKIDEVDDNGDDDASIDDDGIEMVIGLATNTSRWNDVSAHNLLTFKYMRNVSSLTFCRGVNVK